MRSRLPSAARVILPALGIGMLLTASGCTVRLADAAESRAEHRIDVTTVTVVTARGGRHQYLVEVARTEAEQARGLMFRKSMPRNRGMIFPLRPPRMAAFWMENTFIPLDIIFIAPDHRVLNIARGEPRSRATLESIGVAAAVLELNAGEAERIGLRPGDQVEGDF